MNQAARMPRAAPLRHGALVLALVLGCGAATAQEREVGRVGQRVDPAEARMPELPPAVIDNTLTIGGEGIDAAKVRSRMTVAVKINGTGPYRFIIDSGADSSVVGQRIAEALQLPAGTPALLNTMTDSAWVGRVRVDELQLGPTTVTDLVLPALREGDVGADGMIGLDALVEQRLMLDFEERTISVGDAFAPAPRLDGEIVVTARLKRGQLILTHAKANGLPVDAVIDTGTEISIGNAALLERLVRRNQKFDTIEVTGVTGVTATLQLAVVKDLRLGPVRLRNVPIAFAEVPPFEVFGLTEEPALLLGTDLMETFRKVSLDFRARKVRFQLRKCTATVKRLNAMVFMATRLSSDRDVPEACQR